jgi:hypothetical protein
MQSKARIEEFALGRPAGTPNSNLIPRARAFAHTDAKQRACRGPARMRAPAQAHTVVLVKQVSLLSRRSCAPLANTPPPATSLRGIRLAATYLLMNLEDSPVR